MTRTKKMVCHDCGTIFNRKPQNGDKQVCWNCSSMKVTLVTEQGPPPSVGPGPQGPGMSSAPVIPKAPDPSGLKLPFGGAAKPGGAITPEMLLKQRGLLKKVVRPPVVLPGVANSQIARGVRLLAHAVRNPTLNCIGMELELVWREKGSKVDLYAYHTLPTVDLSNALSCIAQGLINPEHGNFNDHYGNASRHLPTRKGPRNATVLQGISYYEYGWKRIMPAGTKWHGYNNNVKVNYGPQDNSAINSFLKNLRQSKVFCERLVIAETGEVFYTPDHYGTFFRYHPGTKQWYRYRAAGAGGPTWDESFYDEPR